MKKKQDKINNYAKYVKEMYWPAVDKEKENINTANTKSERTSNRSLKRNSTADKAMIQEKRTHSMRRPEKKMKPLEQIVQSEQESFSGENNAAPPNIPKPPKTTKRKPK